MLNEASVVDGRIHKSCGGFYSVYTAGGMVECRARGLFRREGATPLVGDLARVELLPDGTGSVVELLSRKNALERPPLANLDQLLLISSTARPRPNLRILDLLLVTAERAGMEPLLVFTKSDLQGGEPLASLYRACGYRACAVARNASEDAVEEIRGRLAGKISALCGNTGVGKSTLLNRIDPSLALPTGEISEKLGRGRHTTRHVELFSLAGGWVADTPGFSSLEAKARDLPQKEELAAAFREFAPYLDDCRFRDCAHISERGCRVLRAVEDGEIPKSRHESYVALWITLNEQKPWEKS
ncbi:MAG: ribosome small subunit-dependent GTPase A [Oscillospiraceae bacterium]|nr:ribosome small subunit-dependent GTPase A [Oscillospiraceae bacterium]